MPEELAWLRPENTGYILLCKSAERKLRRFRQIRPNSSEAGGIILGYRRGEHIEIADVTTPFSRDIRKRTFFDRCDPRHQSYAFKEWLGSFRKIGYLGEWHTHPEDMPSPSQLDIREWRALQRKQSEPMVFMIVGRKQDWIGCAEGQSIIQVLCAE